MAILLKTASVWVSSIQIIQVRVQNKGKSVWKSRYVGDVLVSLVHVCFHDQAARFVYFYISPGDQSSAKRLKFIGKSCARTVGAEGLTRSGANMGSTGEDHAVA